MQQEDVVDRMQLQRIQSERLSIALYVGSTNMPQFHGRKAFEAYIYYECALQSLEEHSPAEETLGTVYCIGVMDAVNLHPGSTIKISKKAQISIAEVSYVNDLTENRWWCILRYIQPESGCIDE